MQTPWEYRYAHRSQKMGSSVIRELLKLTEQPDIISFAPDVRALTNKRDNILGLLSLISETAKHSSVLDISTYSSNEEFRDPTENPEKELSDFQKQILRVYQRLLNKLLVRLEHLIAKIFKPVLVGKGIEGYITFTTWARPPSFFQLVQGI